ncbi:hypothetical protein D9758_009199 [Tetrapyrgos nigripes]|uniref:C2H2-type domain-containing protein n=1 Tax=Tetrapyrgos nigripes TaxID=182062 RepID=A0A8H5D1Y3_9AGAR|nr:hypothetical protein D9758_009199 [Tetrapyrgos nigripes]
MSDNDSETVVIKGVWTFSRPFSRFGVIPIGGRSTAIKLRDGDVWVLASTPLDSKTKSTLETLGPVRYIIGADAVHHLFLSEFKRAYPDAKLIAPQGATENVADKSLKFDGVWGRDPPDTMYGFEEEIKHCYFSGFINKDVAFLHVESKTLIEADLLFNLPPKEQYSQSPSSGQVPGFSNFGPSSWLHSKVSSAMNVDSARAMKFDVKTVTSWDFDRIIPCHGHYQREHATVKCLCGVGVRKDLLPQHYKESDRHPTCGTCDESFQEEGHYQEHLLTKHVDSTCSKCALGFNDHDALTKHWLTSSEHPVCSRCERGFIDEESLQEHLDSEHPLCTECQTRFDCPETLDWHWKELEAQARQSLKQCEISLTDDDVMGKHLSLYPNLATIVPFLEPDWEPSSSTLTFSSTECSPVTSSAGESCRGNPPAYHCRACHRPDCVIPTFTHCGHLFCEE